MTLREKVEQFQTGLHEKGQKVSYSEAKEMFLIARDFIRSTRRLTMNKLWKIQDCLKDYPDCDGLFNLIMQAKEM